MEQLGSRTRRGLRAQVLGHALELLAFGYKNAASCILTVFIFLLLAVSRAGDLPLVRYDFLLLGCLAVQGLMLVTRLETLDELEVICVFHVLGLALEFFKTHIGSWAYPEDALTKLGTVSLYSGFMYASVARFMCQAWRRFDIKLLGWPAAYLVVPLGAAIYLNFFSHHFIFDLRWLLLVFAFLLF